MSNHVVIGAGSNIDARDNIQLAFSRLKERFDVVKISSVIKTAPVGITAQTDFLNAAVSLRTNLTRSELVKELKRLENELGRDRSRPKFGPREIDLDVVVWNGEIVDEDYHTREFLQRLVNEVV